ncbi:four helix bundle protein [Candidatus Riflebacteria bacterium]
MKVPAKKFTDLVVWQKSHAFVPGIYQVTQAFPKHEIYSLTSQFRRAAVSIAANVAEGFRKHSKADKARFLNISEGSLEECRYYLILARDLGYINKIDNLWELSEEIGRLLNSYRSAILTPISYLLTPKFLLYLFAIC